MVSATSEYTSSTLVLLLRWMLVDVGFLHHLKASVGTRHQQLKIGNSETQPLESWNIVMVISNADEASPWTS